MSSKKIKVLVLSDHPLSPSGVGTQTKYMIESCLETGQFSFVCLGGAMKHQNYSPVKVSPYEDDFIIFPVDGYGNQEQIRSLLKSQKPDIVWFMTDPRFWGWLWEIENEVRANVPMVYYHVWDNYPFPMFNKDFYNSNDVIACISKVTHDIVKNVAPEVESCYLPHAVNNTIFKPLEKQEYYDTILSSLPQLKDKFVFFWNNRNARRKQSGSLIFWFKTFLDRVGHDKAALLMHTDPFDNHGQDLNAIVSKLGLTNGEVMFSTQPVPAETLAKIYNFVDCTINISDAEGFGLATLESLSCGTPIIVNMTGGLQEQVTDGENWFGIGLEPCSKAIIGSQQVPYIYEDRISEKDIVDAMLKMFNMASDDRQKLSELGQKHVEKNYNFEDFKTEWPKLLKNTYDKYGSWENRKEYKSWHLMEIK